MVNFQEYFQGGQKKLLIPPKIFLEVKGWGYKNLYTPQIFFKFWGVYKYFLYPTPLPLRIFWGVLIIFLTPQIFFKVFDKNCKLLMVNFQEYFGGSKKY